MRKWILTFAATLVVSSIAMAAYDSCIAVDDGSGTNWTTDRSPTQCVDLREIGGLEYHHLVRNPAAAPDAEHEKVVFLKEIDSTSVKFWSAYNDDQLLQRVVFRFYRQDPQSGGLVVHHTVTLESVRVMALELIDIEPLDASTRLPARERIRLEYGTITIDAGGQQATLTNPNGPIL